MNDERVRVAAFQFLDGQTKAHGDSALPRSVLATGFMFEGGWSGSKDSSSPPSFSRAATRGALSRSITNF